MNKIFPSRIVKFVFCFFFYYLFARWLPPHYIPILGNLSKRLRAVLCKPLLRKCGRDVNIEFGSYFGSGARISLGNFSDIGINSRLQGEISIGDNVMMAPDVIIMTVPS